MNSSFFLKTKEMLSLLVQRYCGIVIKLGIGKLEAPSKLFEYIKQDFEELPILWSHTMELHKLESIHRDPFDRLLIAQAKVEGLTLVTRDKNILKYPINLMEA